MVKVESAPLYLTNQNPLYLANQNAPLLNQSEKARFISLSRPGGFCSFCFLVLIVLSPPQFSLSSRIWRVGKETWNSCTNDPSIVKEIAARVDEKLIPNPC